MIKPPHLGKTIPPVIRGIFDFETLHEKTNGCNKCKDRLSKMKCRQTVSIKCTHNENTEKNTSTTFKNTDMPAICYYLRFIDKTGLKILER